MSQRRASQPEASTARKDLVANEILDRAATIFADRGFQGAGIRDIADAMQMSRPAVYHYFATKEALLEALVAGVTVEILEFIRALRRDPELDHVTKLERLVRGLVERVAAKPAHMRLLAASDRSLPDPVGAEHAAGRRAALAEVEALIAEGVAAGDLRAANPRVAAFALLGMCNWIAWWYRPGAGLTVEEIATEFTAFVLHGLPVTAERRLRGSAGQLSNAVALLREDVEQIERILGSPLNSNGRG